MRMESLLSQVDKKTAELQRKKQEHWMAVGFGLTSFRMVGMGIDFKALDTQQTLAAFRCSAHRAILLDWGGTLTPPVTDGFYDQRDTEAYSVPQPVLAALTTLCADPKNQVMILSGLGKEKAADSSAPRARGACSCRELQPPRRPRCSPRLGPSPTSRSPSSTRASR